MDAKPQQWITHCQETNFESLGNPWAHEALVPVLRGDEPSLVFNDLQLEPPADGSLQKVLPIRSVLAVPVPGADARLYGILLLGDLRPDAFPSHIVEEARTIGEQIGVLVDNWTLHSRLSELETLQRTVVHELQEALRPPVPVVPHTELGVWYVAAEPGPTGGDLHDWMLLPDGDLHLAVVDVVGKGISASKNALAVTHALRLLVLDGCPLDELMARADRLTSAQDPELAATAVVARYRPSTGEVRIVGAGHPPPLIVSGDEVREIEAGGVPLGWPGEYSDERCIVLGRSDVLVLYTDGLVESTKNILDGLDSLRRASVKTAQYPATYLARALVETALMDAKWQDDSLALVLRRRTPPPSSPKPLLGPFEYRFSPFEANVTLARHMLADWMARIPIPQDEAEDILVMASELCTNAVTHGSKAAALRAWPQEHDLVIEVEDDGGSLEWPERRFGDLPDSTADRGRGLFLVEALADDIDSIVEPGRTIVRCVKRAVVPNHVQAP